MFHSRACAAVCAAIAVSISLTSLPAIAAAALGATQPENKQEPSATAQITFSGNSKANYQGDYVTFPVWILANKITVVDGSGKYPATKTCIPPGTHLRGYVGTTDGYLFKTGDVAPPNPRDQSTDPKNIAGCGDAARLVRSDMVNVTSQTMTIIPPDRFGWSYGVLAIPFKMQLGKVNDLQASATLGPYLGYTIDHELMGFSMTPLAFLGPTIFNVKPATAGQNSSGTGFGISAGTGVTFVIKDSFQLGFVAGYDHAGANSGYQYNDRFWVSAAIGFAFN